VIDSNTLAMVKKLAPVKVEARCDRFLLCAERLIKGISGGVRFGGPVDKGMIETRQQLAAWTECQDEKEVAALARFLSEEGLISLDEVNTKARITLKGWRRIDDIRLRIVPSVQGFLAMWFDPSLEPAYREGFDPASRFVVADFTSERDRPRVTP
jgi:hypothetical protein